MSQQSLAPSPTIRNFQQAKRWTVASSSLAIVIFFCCYYEDEELTESTIRFVRRILSTCIFALFLSCGQANAQDAQEFRVTVSEAISLRSPGNALIAHDTTNSDQVFPEQTWTAYTTNLNGATVDFTFGKFIHENFAFFRRNARVDLRVVSSDPFANWVATVSSAQTTGYFGNTQVAVSAESIGSGAGELGLTVSFLEFNPNFLAGGHYNMTVVGQITNK